MPISSQFSLGLDLSHPINGLAKLIGRSAVDVIRHFRDSGSDIFLEDEFAVILGGSIVEERMLSTFRQTVDIPAERSTLSKALDLVVEAGVGPTVQCALLSQAHLRSLIQLSMLAWTHDLTELSVALSRAVEKCAEHAPPSIPFKIIDASDLKGTLKACRDQTAAFPWNHFFRAVEAKLEIDMVDWSDDMFVKNHRSLSCKLLEALISMIPRVQRAPNEYRLVIQTSQALSLIVVWAHHVLGLDVKVVKEGFIHYFGSGSDCVVIEYTTNDDRNVFQLPESTASLYTVDSGEVQFRLELSDSMDAQLRPGAWQCLEGYGAVLLGREFERSDLVCYVGEFVVALSAALAHDKREEYRQQSKLAHVELPQPEKQLFTDAKILEVGNIVFGQTLDSARIKKISQDLEDCQRQDDLLSFLDRQLKTLNSELHEILEQAWDEQDPYQLGSKRCNFLQRVVTLSRLLHICCRVANVDICRKMNLSLNLGIQAWGWNFGVPSALASFDVLAKLMTGNESLKSDAADYAALSSCGWTMHLASIPLQSPASIAEEIYIRPGSLARNGVRKDFIKDGLSGSAQIWRDSDERYGAVVDTESTIIESDAGIFIEPRCFSTDTRRSNRLVTSSEHYFAVLYEFSCGFKNHQPKNSSSVTLGFRRMQQIASMVDRTPACMHPTVTYAGKARLPENAMTFTGWRCPVKMPSGLSEAEQRPECSTELCISLISGHVNARWVFLYRMIESRGRTVFLKSDNCCLQCAVDYTMRQVPGKPKILVM